MLKCNQNRKIKLIFFMIFDAFYVIRCMELLWISALDDDTQLSELSLLRVYQYLSYYIKIS